MPDVSVIIPTTRPETLQRALASVEAQTDPPLEVLVEEDPGRRGAALTRNAGAARARGSLLAFLDDDDEWEPEFLEQVRVPDGCVLAYSALEHLHATDPLQGSPTVPSAAVLRADAFREVGGFRSFALGEDYDLFLRLHRMGGFHRVAQTLLRYTRRPDEDRYLGLRIFTAAILEDFREQHAAEFGARGRRSLAREYRLLARHLQRRPGLTRRLRRAQRAAAAASLRLRPHTRALQAWLASFFARGAREAPLPPPPPKLFGPLALLYERSD